MDLALAELLLFLLQVVVEVLIQGGLEVIAETGMASHKAARDRPNHKRIVAVSGLLVLGAVVGAVSLALWPRRFFSPGPIPGLSLVLGPLGVGGIMHMWGKQRRARGHVTTNLATFAGGAAFALGTALVRFLWAG